MQIKKIIVDICMFDRYSHIYMITEDNKSLPTVDVIETKELVDGIYTLLASHPTVDQVLLREASKEYSSKIKEQLMSVFALHNYSNIKIDIEE